MNAKQLALLTLVTAVVCVLAILSLRNDPLAQARGAADEKLFEGLLERVDDVAAFTIHQAGSTLEIERGDDEWVLSDRGGYPVQFERVKSNILSIAQLEVVESKTAKPERHAELGLEEPSLAAPMSTRIVLRDAAGAELADVIIGTQQYSQPPRVFVRRGGEDQTWLCEVQRRFDLTGNLLSWVDRTLVRVARDRIARVDVTHPDGEVVTVVATDEAGDAWELLGIPDGRELEVSTSPGEFGSFLNYLTFDDFAPADEVDFNATLGAVARFETRDGLVVHLHTTEREVDGEPATTWCRAEFSTTDDADAAVVPEASELQGRVGPWAFQLPAYRATQLLRRMETLLAEPEEETAGPALPPIEGGTGTGAPDDATPDEAAVDEPADPPSR